jgi:hypothetical protein
MMHGIKKAPETLGFRGSESFWTVETFSAVLSLREFPYLFEDRQTLPKTPEKTEMVLRFPLGFA